SAAAVRVPRPRPTAPAGRGPTAAVPGGHHHGQGRHENGPHGDQPGPPPPPRPAVLAPPAAPGGDPVAAVGRTQRGPDGPQGPHGPRPGTATGGHLHPPPAEGFTSYRRGGPRRRRRHDPGRCH